MTKISPVVRILLFAMCMAVIIPLSLWSLIQLYEWSCATWISCEGMKRSK